MRRTTSSTDAAVPIRRAAWFPPVYGAKIMKDLGLIPEGYKILVTATVQEEDCDGLCWQYIHNEDKIKPEFVVSTEPTDGGIYRGHRGRMEIRVDVKGISCHGSAPERGDNAIYKMADILKDVEALNARRLRIVRRDQGPVQDARAEIQPRSLRGRALLRARHLHGFPDFLHQPLPLRCCGQLLDLDRPPHDRGRNLGQLH